MTRSNGVATSLWRIRLAAMLLFSVNLDAQAPRRTLTEDLRIDAAQLLIAGVAGVETLNDGRLLIADMDGLLILSPRGDLVQRIGRMPSGTPARRRMPPPPSARFEPPPPAPPVDFNFINRIGVVGDTIWVADWALYRIVLLDADGSLIRIIPGDSSVLMVVTPDPQLRRAPTIVRPANVWTTPFAVLPGGTTLTSVGTYRAPGAPWPVGMPLQTAIVTGALNGVRKDTIARLTTYNTMASVKGSEPGFGQWVANPFWQRNFFSASADGRRLAFVEEIIGGPNAGEYQVRVCDENGRSVYQRVVSLARLLIPPTVAESLVVAAIAKMTRFQGNADSAVRASVNMPSTFPPITSVLVSSAGDVWLRGREDPGGTMYTILNAVGEPSATVLEPPGTYVLSVGRDFVWGVQSNAANEPTFVVRYRISNR